MVGEGIPYSDSISICMTSISIPALHTVQPSTLSSQTKGPIVLQFDVTSMSDKERFKIVFEAFDELNQTHDEKVDTLEMQFRKQPSSPSSRLMPSTGHHKDKF